MTTSSSTPVSAWSPFKQRAFALLWTATLISNIGTWMHDVGAGWLMTTLSPSPAVVALVQAATTAPIFLFALFAGALADRVEKKTLLVAVNVLMAVAAALMAFAVHAEMMTPALLVIFTFVLGTGAAFMAPAWQAVVPSLVPRTSLQPAIALNSMGINISRAIGPALAGFLIAAVGLAAPFIANFVSILVIIAALLLWKPATAPERKLPPEPIFGAMATGLRHARHNPALRATLLRALGFFVFASAYWALLPLIARGIPGGDAQLYGILLTSTGAAAVGGALVLPRIRKVLSPGSLVDLGTIGSVGALLLFAFVPAVWAAVLGSLLAGASWIAVLTSLNVSAQTALPNWVRARGLSVFLMVFFGSMAAGSAIWGQVATYLSIPVALGAAAAGLVLALPFIRPAKLGQGESMDLTPAAHWPALPSLPGDEEDRGPVMVTIDYRIEPEDEHDFLVALYLLKGERYRDGAYDWGVGQSVEDPEVWTEWFVVASWLEHERQHHRVTQHDKALQDAVHAFHRGADRPRVTHLIAPPAQ